MIGQNVFLPEFWRHFDGFFAVCCLVVKKVLFGYGKKSRYTIKKSVATNSRSPQNRP
jgi:hypothetical protein